MIVWRSSYYTEIPMPLDTVAIVSVAVSVSVNIMHSTYVWTVKNVDFDGKCK